LTEKNCPPRAWERGGKSRRRGRLKISCVENKFHPAGGKGTLSVALLPGKEQESEKYAFACILKKALHTQ